MTRINDDLLAVRRALRHAAPRTPNQLHAFVRIAFGFAMPRIPMIEGHAAPFEYLQHVYFEDGRPRDCLVWANRGGGKTQLGAIATMLDLLFKPGIQVRILGGSFEQSSKMYGYLKRMLEDEAFRDLIAGNLTGRSVQLINGSRVEVLSQSERAVRGQRVHKLRCDEVELFDEEVWDAAQLVTRSGWCGDVYVPGAIEALSTMHRPHGIMQRLVTNADAERRRIFRWSVLDTLERCPSQRSCDACPLWSDCHGMAKHARGFVHIDDAIQQQDRIGAEIWQAEMLCERPNRTNTVYPTFDRDVHVLAFDAPVDSLGERVTWIGGMDFGYRSPTVLLWAFVDRMDGAEVVHVIDELSVENMVTERVIELAAQRPWPRPAWIGADPAGGARNEQTGRSTINLWRSANWPIRARRSLIEPGVAAVSARLKSAAGDVRLRIHPRCTKLIRALELYHYPEGDRDTAQPVKDGNDHAADALRYMIINLDRGDWRVKVVGY